MALCVFGSLLISKPPMFCSPETPVTPGKRKAEAKKEKGTPPAKKVKTDGEGETCTLYSLVLAHLTSYDDHKGLNTDVCDVTFNQF